MFAQGVDHQGSYFGRRVATVPGTWRLKGGISGREGREKVGQVQLEFPGRVICHGVQVAGMVEDGWGDAELPVHQVPNSEEVRYHRVDGRGLPEVSGHGRGAVTSSEQGAPSRTGAYERECGLL